MRTTDLNEPAALPVLADETPILDDGADGASFRAVVGCAIGLAVVASLAGVWWVTLAWALSADSLSGLHVLIGKGVAYCYVIAFPVWAAGHGLTQAIRCLASDSAAPLPLSISRVVMFGGWFVIGIAAARYLLGVLPALS